MSRFPFAALAAVLLLAFPAAGGDTPPVPTPSPRAAQILGSLVHMQRVYHKQELRAAWTQYGPGGVVEARAVVDAGDCPEIAFDLRQRPMQTRAAGNGDFLTVCSAVVPPGTRQAALVFANPGLKSPPPGSGAAQADIEEWFEAETGMPMPGPEATETEYRQWHQRLEEATKPDIVPLPLPVADPQRILVFGDTGCRIKGKALQDCSDPDAWPFARVAAQAARLRPDLVIHVGDYLYRENACPADFKGCTGTPHGDNWPTWDADFFAPAQPLLAASPWVIVRGNHEDCERAGPGFLRLLGPEAFDPAAPCIGHLPQYTIPLERMTLAVADNADAPETSVVEKEVPVYRAEIASLAGDKAPVWWLLHRPIWGAISGPLGVPIGGNLTLMAAVAPSGIPSSVELMLSGHIHSFEAINYEPDDHVPPQLVAGFGGDKLDVTPSNLRGAIFQGSSGVHIKDGISLGGFGFVLMTRMEKGWTIDAYDPSGRIVRQCRFHEDRMDCPSQRR